MLCTQQQHREEKVEELQAEAKRVTRIIQHVHQKLQEAIESIEKVILGHISSDLIQELKKREEEVRK